MRLKQLLFLLLFLWSGFAFAQDVIVKKDGATIVCRVVELNASEIVYKRWSDLNGANYVMDRSLASAINYEDGRKVDLADAANLYLPGNQNDGTQRFNDKALLQIDAASRGVAPNKKAKRLKIVGSAVGGALAVAGGIIMLTAPSDYNYDGHMATGGANLGVGVIGAGACWLAALRMERQQRRLEVSTLYRHDFPLSNGTSLSAGVDVLHDKMVRSNTLGVGFSYNF